MILTTKSGRQIEVCEPFIASDGVCYGRRLCEECREDLAVPNWLVCWKCHEKYV